MNININELNDNGKYDTGYRIVYFYDDYYKIGDYSGTIEGFMYNFPLNDPIIDEDDILPFISAEDLLNRYMEVSNDDLISIAIYDINGNVVHTHSNY